MEKMSSTLPHIQKVLISIGNTLTDSIIHNDNEFQKLNTILNQQICGEVMDDKNQINETTSLKEQVMNLQDNLTSLKIDELNKIKKITEQNQQIINMIKPIDIKKLEKTVHELNEKIPDIEPLLKEFTKMFKTLDRISKAVGDEE